MPNATFKKVGCLIKPLKLLSMKNLGIIMTLALFLGLVGCGEGGIAEWELETSLKCRFGLTNNSGDNGNIGEAVNMWITEESIGPDNIVPVDVRREKDYFLKNMLAEGETLTEWEEVTVYVGRNGNVLTSFTTSINNASVYARFTWDGTTLTQY